MNCLSSFESLFYIIKEWYFVCEIFIQISESLQKKCQSPVDIFCKINKCLIPLNWCQYSWHNSTDKKPCSQEMRFFRFNWFHWIWTIYLGINRVTLVFWIFVWKGILGLYWSLPLGLSRQNSGGGDIFFRLLERLYTEWSCHVVNFEFTMWQNLQHMITRKFKV